MKQIYTTEWFSNIVERVRPPREAEGRGRECARWISTSGAAVVACGFRRLRRVWAGACVRVRCWARCWYQEHTDPGRRFPATNYQTINPMTVVLCLPVKGAAIRPIRSALWKPADTKPTSHCGFGFHHSYKVIGWPEVKCRSLPTDHWFGVCIPSL